MLAVLLSCGEEVEFDGGGRHSSSAGSWRYVFLERARNAARWQRWDCVGVLTKTPYQFPAAGRWKRWLLRKG
ncbi:hypothetical protein HPP92_029085 [Vanilla planifolia]|uniref:Uncharacterized protein n=1 Tax=Vanilla planifolia TaxID=51239 RepID=A0A835P5J9_VANPL|nr:hypothetical protein HPP92_029074 [Vanilla planifolia]KAG0445944.1 hypothetical protein HPP92_029085 [Vanilla planifolia]